MSRLDYCDMLYAFLGNDTEVTTNSICCMTYIEVSRFDHNIFILQELHWLMITYHAQFKVLISTYIALLEVCISSLLQILIDH